MPASHRRRSPFAYGRASGVPDQRRGSGLRRAATLAEPLRLALYDYVDGQRRPVGRDEAAAALGVSRSLAAFHLDRLVQEALLAVEYRRLSGRSGPGAGRPAKLYRVAAAGLELSVPPRRYELAADVLASALEAAESPAALEALSGSARATGRALGAAAIGRVLGNGVQERGEGGDMPAGVALDEPRAVGVEAPAGATVDEATGVGGHVPAGATIEAPGEHAVGEGEAGLLVLLAQLGFQPRAEPAGSITLGNCPFHGLREAHADLICGMNRSLVEGLLQGAGTGVFEPCLEPAPDRCCVVLRRPD